MEEKDSEKRKSTGRARHGSAVRFPGSGPVVRITLADDFGAPPGLPKAFAAALRGHLDDLDLEGEELRIVGLAKIFSLCSRGKLHIEFARRRDNVEPTAQSLRKTCFEFVRQIPVPKDAGPRKVQSLRTLPSAVLRSQVEGYWYESDALELSLSRQLGRLEKRIVERERRGPKLSDAGALKSKRSKEFVRKREEEDSRLIRAWQFGNLLVVRDKRSENKKFLEEETAEGILKLADESLSAAELQRFRKLVGTERQSASESRQEEKARDTANELSTIAQVRAFSPAEFKRWLREQDELGANMSTLRDCFSSWLGEYQGKELAPTAAHKFADAVLEGMNRLRVRFQCPDCSKPARLTYWTTKNLFQFVHSNNDKHARSVQVPVLKGVGAPRDKRRR